MTWFEQISIRLANQDDVENLLTKLDWIKQSARSLVELECFRNTEIESDWIVILRSRNPEAVPQKSKLGRMIVEALKPYGLLNHMVWEQLNQEKTT